MNPPLSFFSCLLWFLSAMFNRTLMASSHCSSTISLQEGTDVSIKNTEIMNLSFFSFFPPHWCVHVNLAVTPVSEVPSAISKNTMCSTWFQAPANCTMSSSLPSSEHSRWSSYVWWCSALPGESYTQRAWMKNAFKYIHTDICEQGYVFAFTGMLYLRWKRRCRHHNSSASGWPKQFMTFNKRFYKCFVGAKTAPLSTVAEEEEVQNESTSTCKERWGAGVREEMRIYYSTDCSYSAINASCYSAIPIQG